MEGLFSLLLFGVFFYVMMRFGCGSHMVHGLGLGDSHSHGANASHVDIVCGMQVAPDKGYGRMFHGQLYRFCSKNCLNKFDEDPEKYINNPQTSDDEGMMS